MDRYVSISHQESIALTNRFAVLAEDTIVLPGEEEAITDSLGKEPPPDSIPQSPCCQQLAATFMELLLKEAILTSHTMAMLLDKFKSIDDKISDLKRAINNLAVDAERTGSTNKWVGEVKGENKLAADVLPHGRTSGGECTTPTLLTLQRNSVAISFNGQSDYFRWRNFNTIMILLSQLLRCSKASIALQSYFWLSRRGIYSRLVLQFKNEVTPAKMMSLKKVLFNKFGILVTRVFKNNVITPICIRVPPANQHRQPGKLVREGPSQVYKSAITLKDDVQGHHSSLKRNDNAGLKAVETAEAISEMRQEGVPENCQTEEAIEMELDLRSHRVIATPVNTVPDNASLANEMQEADQEWAQQFLSLPKLGMERPESTLLPTVSLPCSGNSDGVAHFAYGDRPGALRSTMIPGGEEEGESPGHDAHLIGKLGSSLEDDIFLSFGELTKQEQHEVIETLEYTKNRLLILKENTSDKHVGDSTGEQENRDEARVDLHFNPAPPDEADPCLCAPLEEGVRGEDLREECDSGSSPFQSKKNG